MYFLLLFINIISCDTGLLRFGLYGVWRWRPGAAAGERGRAGVP